jgi:hypothetical protein
MSMILLPDIETLPVLPFPQTVDCFKINQLLHSKRLTDVPGHETYSENFLYHSF